MINSATPIRIAAAVALGAAVALAPGSAQAAGPQTVCVGSTPECVATLSAALAGVRDGDTVRIGPGIYQGGITINKSIRLVGSGADRTVIDGGGPVVTVARATDPAGLNVSISAVTVSGGVTTGNGFESRGGGIDISPAPHDGVGATVQLSGVIVTNNRATATTTSDSPSGVKCPKTFCPCAGAAEVASPTQDTSPSSTARCWPTASADRSAMPMAAVSSASSAV
jgi:hypothetical protein